MGPSNLVVLFQLSIFAAVGVVGYLWARSFENRYGRKPMNTSPLFWGLFCALLTLLALVALAVAEIKASKEPRATTFRAPAAVPPSSGPATPLTPAPGWSSGDTILPGK